MAVPRYCSKRDKPAVLDDDGFLLDPAGFYGALVNPYLVPLSQLAEERTVALLGEPGSGKTTSLSELAELFRQREPGTHIVSVDLLEVTDRALFAELVRERLRVILPPAGDATSPTRQIDEGDTAESTVDAAASESSTCSPPDSGHPPACCVLILDGIDECPLDARVLARLLAEALRSVDHSELRVFAGARTADWPAVLERTLADAGRDVAAFELAPLRRIDSGTFAESCGLDQGRFMQAVDAAGAAPLAAIPITLKLLVTLFGRDLELPATTAELYRQGMLALADEPDLDRREADQRSGNAAIPPQHRVVIASRIAGWLHLCGRAAVWCGPVAETPRSDIAEGDLSGASEPIDSREIGVSADGISMTLRTAMFAGRGSHRLGVSHQSFGAYLTARFLQGHRMAEPQLRGLLLSTPPSGTAAAHLALRETAAWLVSLDPVANRWLVEADPETIASYPIISKNREVRAELVESLLALAEADMLRSASRIRYDHLSHPGLDGQLRPVLQMGGHAQKHLAIQIAGACRARSVFDDLIGVALDENQADGLRVEAASAAARLDKEQAAVRLRSLLIDLRTDPADEIRAAALTVCWPEQISTAELFEALTPPKRPDFIGSYHVFVDRLPGRLSDDDLTLALAWSASRLSGPPKTAGYEQGRKLLERVLPRAWRSSRRPELIPQIAAALHQLTAVEDHDIEFLDADGSGTDAADRRQLAAALVGLATTDSHAWHISYLSGRSGLLIRPTDLQWLFEREQVADDDAATRWHMLIRTVFRVGELLDAEIAWPQRGSRAWKAVLHQWFEAVNLSSELAHELKRINDRDRRVRAARRDPARRDSFTADLTKLLQAAESGQEPDVFWRFCWLMHHDPANPGASTPWTDDLTELPGYRFLDEGNRRLLITAASRFLSNSCPHEDDWIDDAAILDRRPLAAYLALAMLEREASDLLDQISPEILRRWVPAILWYRSTATDAEGRARKRRLLERLRICASDLIAPLVIRCLRASSGAGQRATELDLTVNCWTPALADALIGELSALARNDGDNYQIVLRLLIRQSDPRAVAVARRDLAAASTAPKPARWAALALLRENPGLYWDYVFVVMRQTPVWGKELTQDLARDWADPPLLPVLAEPELGDLYRWLTRQYPPEQDVWVEGAHFVGRGEQVRAWRNQVLEHLIGRGTGAAVQVVQALVAEQPERPWLRRRLLAAEEQRLSLSWSQPSPRQLHQLISDPAKRYLQHEADLLEVVATTIRAIERESLHGITPLARLLWNEFKAADGTLWRPKPEGDISDFLADQLRVRIKQRGIFVNREVEFQRVKTRGVGERADILAQAAGSQIDSADRGIAIVIEVKGNWNTGLLTEMRTQLADHYMRIVGADHGIYLVAWFPPDQWDTADSNQAVAARLIPGELDAELVAQAEQLRISRRVMIEPIIIAFDRPRGRQGHISQL